MKPSCLACRFFSPHSNQYGHNECRRRSPAPRLTYDGRHDELGLGAWPVVLEEHWCGEFEPQGDFPAEWRLWNSE